MSVRFMMAVLTALVLSACGNGPSQEPSTEAQPAAQAQELGKQCGTNTCGSGEFCCNESCGICAPKGGFCTQQVCEPTTLCGTNTCGTGEFCCNASCGICAPLGDSCIQQVCDPVIVEEAPVAPVNKVQPPDQDAGKKCGTNSCGAGEYCCNESCGICVPMGNSCTQEVCPPPL
ncbi:MAG TPA: hypothetical protein VE153_25170 [Myxococcus sp.]|nr:hypothetical protein [Myxococcus sp.]